MSYVDLLSDGWSISIITAMEVIVGARDKKELREMDEFLATIPMIPPIPRIGFQAYTLLKGFCKSDGLRILDAMIAATAIEEDKTLVTRNHKHFRMIPDLKLAIPHY